MLTTTGFKPQPIDAFLIVRMWDGERRVVGTQHSEVLAQRAAQMLSVTCNHNGATYHVEPNPKTVVDVESRLAPTLKLIGFEEV